MKNLMSVYSTKFNQLTVTRDIKLMSYETAVQIDKLDNKYFELREAVNYGLLTEKEAVNILRNF